MAKQPPRSDSNAAIGARLTLLRRAYSIAMGKSPEMNKSEFPRHCGIGIQAWHNAESGYARIGLDNAMRVRARTGASLEFIYFDAHRDKLPAAMLAAMEKIEREEKAAQAKLAKRA